MTEDTRTCRVCSEVKPLTIAYFQKNKAENWFYLTCKACDAQQRRERYNSDPAWRALQVMYSMETKISRAYPAAWSGSVARAGAEKLLAVTRCAYCETPNDGVQSFCLDHHMPLALGGQHSLDNLWPCCEPCNRAKHDMPPHAFKAWMDALVFRLAWLKAQ